MDVAAPAVAAPAPAAAATSVAPAAAATAHHRTELTAGTECQLTAVPHVLLLNMFLTPDHRPVQK